MRNRYDSTIPPLIAQTVDEMKRKGQLPKDFVPRRIDADKEEREKIQLSKILDRDTLFRFAYVPFVIAQLVWDYADTVMCQAQWMKLRETRPLSRKIRELKTEYDRIRAPYIDNPHQASEIDNMYIFEDGVQDIFRLYLLNLKMDLKSEYPELESENLTLLEATYQCLIVLKALYNYADMQTVKVQRIVGHKIGKILPEQLYQLQYLLEAFIGDKPMSAKFREQQLTYVKTLSTKMALIGLNDEQLDNN